MKSWLQKTASRREHEMETDFFQHPRRFPKNAPGPFYTTGHECRRDSPDSPLEWCGDCLWCGAPEAEAPTLFAPFDATYTDTYFVRQPVTDEEVTAAILSTTVCCTSAVRYGGRDRAIIWRLHNNPEVCDFIVDGNGELVLTVDAKGDLLPFAQRMVDAGRLKQARKKWWQFWR